MGRDQYQCARYVYNFGSELLAGWHHLPRPVIHQFVTLTGDLVLTKDKAGLVLAKELQSLIGRVVKVLEADKQLPETMELIAVETVKNPFA